jgi:hypothetical protein
VSWFTAPFVWVGKQLRALARGVRDGISRKLQRKYRFMNVDELPEQPRSFTVYIAGEGENVWAATMICPCGCKDVIELNLLPQVRPRWAVSRHSDGTVSLRPSVWRQKNCRSHFVLRNGQIRWC